MTALFLAPHHDDESLFGAFTLLREKPLVAVVYDGGSEREDETEAAMEILGCDVEHWRLSADASLADRIAAADRIFAPMWEQDGQPEHNAVSNKAAWTGADVTHYATYTSVGKTTTLNQVPYEPEWIGLKLRALACYASQFDQPGRAAHFLRDQSEFYA